MRNSTARTPTPAIARRVACRCPAPNRSGTRSAKADTARVVLPDGQADLEQAALHFLQGLEPEQWLQLDRELHEKVLEPQGGLNGACMNGDLTRQMVGAAPGRSYAIPQSAFADHGCGPDHQERSGIRRIVPVR